MWWRRGEVALGFCKAYVQMMREVLCKNLRSPLKKRSAGAFFSLRSTPLFLVFAKIKKVLTKEYLFAFGGADNVKDEPYWVM